MNKKIDTNSGRNKRIKAYKKDGKCITCRKAKARKGRYECANCAIKTNRKLRLYRGIKNRNINNYHLMEK